MIYAKIYVDKDEEGRDILVFDSVKDQVDPIIKTTGERKLSSGYDSNEWHYHGDFIYDKIIGELMECFSKTYYEIKGIING